jgi:hypothetical protein
MSLTRAKRLKLQHDAEWANRVEIDPMEVIREPHLQDLIFQHLSGSDVKNIFILSKTWNQAASESSKAMSKITLKIVDYKKRIPSKDVTLLLKSNRKYQNADIHLDCKTDINRKELLVKKFVSVINLEYAGYLRFDMDMLMLLNSRLQSLKINNYYCDKKELGYILTAFPVLQKLGVSHLYQSVGNINNQSITEFSFGNYLPPNIIKSMKNLKVVTCNKGNPTIMRIMLNEGKSLERVNINYWHRVIFLADIENNPWKIYETMKASDPSISKDILIEYL